MRFHYVGYPRTCLILWECENVQVPPDGFDEADMTRLASAFERMRGITLMGATEPFLSALRNVGPKLQNFRLSFPDESALSGNHFEGCSFENLEEFQSQDVESAWINSINCVRCLESPKGRNVFFVAERLCVERGERIDHQHLRVV